MTNWNALISSSDNIICLDSVIFKYKEDNYHCMKYSNILALSLMGALFISVAFAGTMGSETPSVENMMVVAQAE